MNLTSKALIKNLNDRLLAQGVVVETLIDIILDNELVTEFALNLTCNISIKIIILIRLCRIFLLRIYF